MRVLLLLLLSVLLSSKIDINTATYEDLGKLELSSNQIKEIINFRYKIGEFETIYDLIHIPSISISDIHRIRSSVSINKTRNVNLIMSNYKVERWIFDEGGSNGMSSIWLDNIIEPQNVNNMNYDDLYSIPNLTPIDVTAILKQQDRGYIRSDFELKNSPGISYYGYKNVKDFVQYNNPEDKMHFRFNSIMRTVPITNNPDDGEYSTIFKDNSLPERLTKFSLSFDSNLKIGGSIHRYMGQPSNINTKKFFLELKHLPFFGFRIDQLILGNFTAAFGQGVIMNTTDNFSPRRTGYGFSKQVMGVRSDQTNSNQYVMNGGALQVSSSHLRGVIFSSYHPRDAVINNDGSFTSLIVMQPRLPFGVSGIINQDSTKVFSKLTSSVNELTLGGNFQFIPFHGIQIGATLYESLYDRERSPQIISTITGGGGDQDSEFNPDDYDEYSGDAFYLNYAHSNSADPEIAAMYFSSATSDIWEAAKSSIKVGGFDFTFVKNNIAIQGEYGEIFKNNDISFSEDNPSAVVLSGYVQFNNLNLLTLYRNYDLEYDNPYQRSFSNYQRYKSTIFEDVYWLEDPVYSYLYTANPQPQSEEGFYISSRYQFHRSFVGYLNWDTWNRKADKTKYYRTVATLDWRPVFNFRFKIRQKWQQRGTFDVYHPSPYYSRETRITSRLRLSNFNWVELLYVNNYTTFSPRPRLTDNGMGGNIITVGNVGSPEQSIGMSMNYNIDEKASIKFGSIYINGFVWYIEDSDFRLFNSEDGSIHNWASINLKPISSIKVNFKVSYTKDFSSTKIVEAQSDSGAWISNPLVSNNNIDFRLQINYAI